MIKNKALIDYLVEFHATRDFFECHEIMEEYWKSKQNDQYALLWVAFIQVAVGQYHDRRSNYAGAKRMYESALEKFKQFILIINEIDLLNLCEQIEQRINKLETCYADINMTIFDVSLKQACLEATQLRQLHWGINSKFVSSEIINKHRTRDRSDVIAERQASLQAKQRMRQNIHKETE